MATLLTERQQQILDLIRQAVAHTGFPPTRAEIAQTLGFKSANAAEDHLRALAKKGVIELTAGASRGIKLTDAARMYGLGQLILPVVGRVAAGHPVLAIENIEREINVDPALFTQTPDYLLMVKGLSMRDAGILDGDLLAVKKATDARNGQIVVARIDDEVTVKRYHKKGSIIQLLPENPDFDPIIIASDQDFSIEGIAAGLIRTSPLQ